MNDWILLLIGAFLGVLGNTLADLFLSPRVRGWLNKRSTRRIERLEEEERIFQEEVSELKKKTIAHFVYQSIEHARSTTALNSVLVISFMFFGVAMISGIEIIDELFGVLGGNYTIFILGFALFYSTLYLAGQISNVTSSSSKILSKVLEDGLTEELD